MAHRENIDDLGFLTRLAEKLLAEHGLDAHRVYVTGISNGGFMSQRLGAEASHCFSAIAPVVAGLPAAWCDRVQPSHPVSVMILQGTADPLVPYGGGHVQVGRHKRGQMLSTDETVQRWVRWNACQTEPEVESLPDLDPNDGCRAERRRYSGGREGSAVELWHIEGGGHTWPGASQYLPRRIIGPVCRDFQASREIWRFFQSHPRSR
jgi:polyhydroxybutyrate depolymerase